MYFINWNDTDKSFTWNDSVEVRGLGPPSLVPEGQSRHMRVVSWLILRFKSGTQKHKMTATEFCVINVCSHVMWIEAGRQLVCLSLCGGEHCDMVSCHRFLLWGYTLITTIIFHIFTKLFSSCQIFLTSDSRPGLSVLSPYIHQHILHLPWRSVITRAKYRRQIHDLSKIHPLIKELISLKALDICKHKDCNCW